MAKNTSNIGQGNATDSNISQKQNQQQSQKQASKSKKRGGGFGAFLLFFLFNWGVFATALYAIVEYKPQTIEKFLQNYYPDGKIETLQEKARDLENKWQDSISEIRADIMHQNEKIRLLHNSIKPSNAENDGVIKDVLAIKEIKHGAIENQLKNRLEVVESNLQNLQEELATFNKLIQVGNQTQVAGQKQQEASASVLSEKYVKWEDWQKSQEQLKEELQGQLQKQLQEHGGNISKMLAEFRPLQDDLEELQQSFNSLLIINGLKGHMKQGLEVSSIFKMSAEIFAEDEGITKILQDWQNTKPQYTSDKDILQEATQIQAMLDDFIALFSKYRLGESGFDESSLLSGSHDRKTDAKTDANMESSSEVIEYNNPLIKKIMKGFSLEKTSKTSGILEYSGASEVSDWGLATEQLQELASKARGFAMARKYKQLSEILAKLEQEFTFFNAKFDGSSGFNGVDDKELANQKPENQKLGNQELANKELLRKLAKLRDILKQREIATEFTKNLIKQINNRLIATNLSVDMGGK